jgi:serine protease Do
MSRGIIYFLILVVVLVGGILLGYASHDTVVDRWLTPAPDIRSVTYQEAVATTQAVRQTTEDEISNSRQNAITRTVSLVRPAVVGITVTEVREYSDPWSRFFRDDPLFRQFFPSYRQKIQAWGSGFLISNDGYILTNDHVAGNATKIVATMTNGEKYNAELVGHDLVSDIAVLKVGGKNFSYMNLGNSDNVMVGEWAIAFGNPFGLFETNDQPTVTLGIVSNMNVGNIQSEDNRRIYRNMIQTDAAINSGNSGGPLVNAAGEVIGINTVIFTPNAGSVGVGFAIPINRVKSILEELKRYGKVDRDFRVGFKIQSVDESIARYYGLEKAEGVIVTEVEQNSPALKAGLKTGDVILEINGEKGLSENAVVIMFQAAKTNDVFKLKVFRDDKYLEINLRLQKR